MLILPLSVTVYASVGRETRLRLRVRLGGAPLRQLDLSIQNRRTRLLLETRGLHPGESRSAEVDAASLLTLPPALRRTLLSPALWRAVLGAVSFPRLSVRVNVAFRDAAHTALWYAALHALAEALARCAAFPETASLRVGAVFDGGGACVLLSGIMRARVGNLFRAALVAVGVWLRNSVKEARNGTSD